MGTYDGKTVSRFGINNELNNKPADTQDGKYYINGIGLFCHEFSHTLGLPDIYPTNGITDHNQSPEYWDVMDMGNYQADGYQPIPYSPWEKSIVGWKQPTLLSDTEAKQIKLEPYDKASDAYKIIANSQGKSCCCRISETRDGTRRLWVTDCWYGASTTMICHRLTWGIIPTTRQVSQGS